jgi:hypothetical protein
MSTTATLTALKAAEANLVSAMTSAASELDAVGKGTLDEALARLQTAALAARQRLAGTLAAMRAAIAGVTADLEAAATELYEDLSTEAFVPPDVWAGATAAPAEAPPISTNGDDRQRQPEPAGLPVPASVASLETGSAAEPATPPAEAEPVFLAVPKSDGAPPLPAAREELVLTAAACPPVDDPPGATTASPPTGPAGSDAAAGRRPTPRPRATGPSRVPTSFGRGPAPRPEARGAGARPASERTTSDGSERLSQRAFPRPG